MVKKSVVVFFVAVCLFFSFSIKADNSNYFEKIWQNTSIDESVKILLEGRDKGELSSADYIFLYYLLKAQGEREKAVYSALEGLGHCLDETSAAILTDILFPEFGYNVFTEKIAAEMFQREKEKYSDPLLRVAISNILFVEYLRRGEKTLSDKILDDAGIPPFFFYSVLCDENPRLKLVQADFKMADYSNMKRAERDALFLHIPSSMLNVSSDFLALESIPFNTAEDSEIDLVLIANSSLKIYVDGKLALFKNYFEKYVPSKEVLTFKAKKGNHIIDIFYYSANSGDGMTLGLYARGKNKNVIKYLDAIPKLDETQKVLEISRKDFALNSKGSHFERVVYALYEAFLGNLPASRLDFEKLLKESPESILLKILYLNLIVERSYDLPPSYAVSIGEKIAESILEKNPNCAEALFYNILLKSSSTQKEEILSELRNICDRFPNDSRWFIELSHELESVNFLAEAKEVLTKAEELFPENSFVEEAIYNFYRNRQDFEKSFQYLEKISKRRAIYSEYEKYYYDKGEYSKAIEYLIKSRDIYGNFDFYFEKNMTVYLLKMNRYEDALKVADFLIEANPESEQFLTLKAEILAKMGKIDESLSIFKNIKEKSPKYFDYDYAKWLLTGELPFDKDRVSFEDAKKNFDDKADGASSSYILDHQISLINKDGSVLERYHGIVKIYDKEGVEKEGEVEFPADYLVSLRTVKPDGRVIEPEYVSAKKTIGMTGLEAGDIIEYEYFNLSAPNDIKKNSYYTPYVFLFQDIEKPFFHTCWTVKYPKDFKMDFYEQNLPGKPIIYDEDGLSVRKYDFNAMPRIAYEPLAPFKNYYLPLVDITGNITWDDYFEYLKNQFIGACPVSLEIEEKAKELCSGLKSDEEKVNAVIDFVFNEIEGDGERWSNPTETLLTGQGNRLQLSLALLKCLNIDFEFIVAESRSLRNDKNYLPSQGRFTTPLIKINSKNPYYLYLENSNTNPKILPSYLQGSRYISLNDERFNPKLLPEDYSSYLSCLQKEKRVIDRDGNLTINLHQILNPDESGGLRGILKRVERDRWKEVLQIAFSRQFGNAEIGDFEFKNFDEEKRNLEICAEIFVSSFGTRTNNNLKINNIYERSELLKAFATLKKRELPLSISQPVILNQEYSIILPQGKILSFEKKKKKIETKFGKYFLEVKARKGEIFVKRFLFISEQQIPKEEYPQFADFLKQIDESETTAVEINLK